jgi:Na+-translocating ferredoxin:NAD+ oxidoreductase RnfD subunit
MANQPAGRRPVDKRIAALRRFALTITIFTILGHVWLGLETPLVTPFLNLAVAYGLSLLLERVEAWAQQRPPAYAGGARELINFLLPAHIAALAIGLLIYPGSRLWPFVLATVVAVSAKYLFRAPVNGRMRHVLNPSNLGIAFVLVAFPSVGIAMPYHFTTNVDGFLDWLVPVLLLGGGLMLNTQLTGKWPLIIGWVGGFVAQAVLRGLFTDVSTVAALAPVTGVAFILFTNYMITDPGTTPVRARNQVAFGLATAAAYAGFMLVHISYGIFFALTLVCALRGVWLWADAKLLHRDRTPPVPVAPVPAPAEPAEPAERKAVAV